MDTDSHGWEPELTEVVIGSAFEPATTERNLQRTAKRD
jgi:hypothetical protein